MQGQPTPPWNASGSAVEPWKLPPDLRTLQAESGCANGATPKGNRTSGEIHLKP